MHLNLHLCKDLLAVLACSGDSCLLTGLLVTSSSRHCSVTTRSAIADMSGPILHVFALAALAAAAGASAQPITEARVRERLLFTPFVAAAPATCWIRTAHVPPEQAVTCIDMHATFCAGVWQLHSKRCDSLSTAAR